MKVVEQIITCFPNEKDEISRLYEKSVNFQELCDDYVMVKNSVEKLASTNAEKKSHHLAKMKSLLLELEEELSAFVNKGRNEIKPI